MFRSILAMSCAWGSGACLAVFACGAQAQTVVTLKHQAPAGALISFLLTDGRVLVQSEAESTWYTLTPDQNGAYVDGTWQQVGSLYKNYVPYAMASAVLADGRVVIAGGEYNNNVFAFTDKSAIFDPDKNTWSKLAPPPRWGFIGDSPSTVLPNGQFLLGRKFDKRIAELDPATLTWTELSDQGKNDFNAEEGWTLMPDGTVLTYDVKGNPDSERYDTVKQRWSSLGNTVANLAGPPQVGPIKYGKHDQHTYNPPGETGPGVLRPDGTVFATGAANPGANYGHTAIYTPGANGAVGTWAAGPNFPAGDDAGDSFAALLPTGNVLVEGTSGRLYEFNGTTLKATSFSAGGNCLLVLPTGQILIGGSELYTASGQANPAWAPVIGNAPAEISPGSTYAISGQQFNGLSQANAFGDEFQTATNYPLVSLTNTASGQVVYAKTHDHSSMGVATGTATVSTNFDVPSGIGTGPSTLVVIANGIASSPVGVTVQ
jgi:hypothetical protein